MKPVLIFLWIFAGSLVLSQDNITHIQYGLLLVAYVIRLVLDYIEEVVRK